MNDPILNMIRSTCFLQFLDILLDTTHLTLVLFITVGWLIPKFRIAHLVVVFGTGISWLIFSNGNGLESCILTDLHFQVLRKLGKTSLPETYAQYVFERITGIMLYKQTAYTLSRFSWLIAMGLSMLSLFRERRITPNASGYERI